MTKRTALFTSGGLVMALIAGVLALWLGRGLVGAQASASTSTPSPIVKTETRVVTIKKQRPAKTSGSQQVITIVRPAPSMSASSGGYHGDDGFEQDDQFHGGSGDD